MQRSVISSSIDKLDSISFDDLLARQNPFGGPCCTFDLSGVRLITPAALVQLAAACHALVRDGQSPTIVLDDKSVYTYLIRANFIRAVKEIARIEATSPEIIPKNVVYLSGSNPMLIEVTKITTGTALSRLLDRVVWVLRNNLKYQKYDAFDIATAVSEVSQNTFDHNDEVCGFIAMQVYGGNAKRFLEIGIADYGYGLAATLMRNKKNPPVSTDLQAIYLATKLGTSEYDDPTRGTGLHHLLKIASKHSGSVQIRSGAAAVRYRMDTRKRWGYSVPRMPGVHIALALASKMGA